MLTKKLLSLILSVILIFACLAGCSNKSPEQTNANQTNAGNANDGYTADQSLIFGMDYIAFEGVGNGIDYVKAFELMDNMGVTSIRHWMHATWFFDANYNVIQENVDLMKEILAEMQKYHFQIIGMSHASVGYGHAKVGRDSENYSAFIENYEYSWYMLASLFPEITIWEIDNETNNVDFMPDYEGGSFTLQEMADISTDLFFYGSRGVHAANPNATTVMGGFVTWAPDWLEMVYQNIKSGEYGEGSTNPDDYFQALAWHPYVSILNVDGFVAEQQAFYDTAYEYEGKHKTVYFTELGGFDYFLSHEDAAEAIKTLYTEIPERLPFVESMHYYRAFNNIADNNNQWGLFTDPNPDRVDMEKGVRLNPGMPKLSAYAYQKAAGGSGSLEFLMTDLSGEE